MKILLASLSLKKRIAIFSTDYNQQMQVIEILNYTISNNIKESGGVAIDKEQQRSQRLEPERLITFQKGQGFHMKKKS